MVTMEDYTTFEEIYKLFLSSIQDYVIRKLFLEDEEIAEDLLETFLMRAIPLFRGCEKDIKTVDTVSKTFLVTLDIEEKRILADLMLLSWMDWIINDITQMNLSLNDNDFKHYSEEKNLREKSTHADRFREKTYQNMTDYLLYRTPFNQWAVGNYGL